jgi:tetratricopeptide (TPR) repeat protein
MSTQKSKDKTPVTSKKNVAPTKTSSIVVNKTTSKQSNKVSVKQRILQNFLLIWLDPNIDESKDDCQKILQQFRSIINTIYIFTTSDQCIHFLQKIDHEKVFMVVSGALGQSIIPDIHENSQLDTIYIFCGDKTRHEEWIKQWPKIKGIHTQATSIVGALQKAVKQCNQDSIPVSFVSNTSTDGQNLDQLEPSFMYTQIFKEILFELEYDEQSVKDLVNYCREQYSDNVEELNIINQFARDYRPDSSIWWYTRECFTYQMLNRALRTLESDIITKMGFFIRDLHHQIEKLHSQQFGKHQEKVFTVFRGQGLLIQDFEKLERTKGGLISFNNFLSTSKKEDISLAFANYALTKTEFVGILFKMIINPSTPSTPFAMVDGVSYYEAEEEEILFSMHTVFRIDDIKKIANNKRLYQVTLTLTSDNDRQLQTLTELIREETSPTAKGWYRLGELLLKLGQYGKAEQLYSAVLEQTPSSKEQADIYYQLGRINNFQDDYEKAILFYEKALEIDQKSLPSNHLSLANTYNNIGAVYDNMKEYSNALCYYQKALDIYQKNDLPSDHQDLATSYNNIGFLYYNTEEYSKALSFYQKALVIREKNLPANHPLLATSYNNIASAYYDMKEYSKVLPFYEKALEIEQKTLPANHPGLATTYNNIGWVYRNMNNYPKALSFYERALDIKQRTLPPNHPSLQDTRQSIEYVKKKL